MEEELFLYNRQLHKCSRLLNALSTTFKWFSTHCDGQTFPFTKISYLVLYNSNPHLANSYTSVSFGNLCSIHAHWNIKHCTFWNQSMGILFIVLLGKTIPKLEKTNYFFLWVTSYNQKTMPALGILRSSNRSMWATMYVVLLMQIVLMTKSRWLQHHYNRSLLQPVNNMRILI